MKPLKQAFHGFLLSSMLLSAATPVIGPNINLTKAHGNQYEAAVAINPSDNNQIFIAGRNETGGLAVARSSDGGMTWSAPHIIAISPTPAAGDIPRAYGNVSVAWDKFNNLFLTYLVQGSPTAGTYVGVTVSTDAGVTFHSPTGSGPVLLLPGGSPPWQGDQPTVAVGPGSGGSGGSVWVTYSSIGGIWVSGAGVSGKGAIDPFVSQLLPNQPVSVSFGDIAVGPSGEVVVTYGPIGGAPAAIYTQIDPDGLGTNPFADPVLVTAVNVGGFTGIPAQPNWGIDPEAGLAYDRTSGPHHGRIYLAYTDSPAPGSFDTNIFVRHSDDHGATWSAPVRVNDDTGTDSQFLPRISLDQSTGAVALTWYDARNSPGNNNAQYFGAFSTDGGSSFGANFQISVGTSNQANSAPGPGFRPADYGDYTGNAFSAGRLVPAWADNSNSTSDNPDGATNFEIYSAIVELPSTDAEPPVVSNVQVTPNPVAVGASASLTASVSDAATGGSNIATVSYQVNGGAPAAMAISPTSAVTVTASATLPPFNEAGIYNLCVSGTDTAGNTSSPTCTSVVVVNPALFATGSGTIRLPAGSATFDFTAKYRKDSVTPQGNLTLAVGKVGFKSTSINWLVVTGGPTAVFHGTGILNNSSTCDYDASAWNKSFGTAGTDAFGLRIYNCTGGTTLNFDAAPLSGGNIQIH